MDVEQPTDWPATREAAKAAGAKFYFTGEPCRKGHVGPRRASSGVCVECAREWSAEVYQNSREATLARQKARAARLRLELLEYQRQYYAKNKHKRKERDRINGARYHAEHREERNAKKREHYHANKERYRETTLAARARNPERHREVYKAWAQANPEKRTATANKRRARLTGAGGTYTAEDIKAIYKAQRGRCGYCRASLKAGYEVDHIKAIARGGTNDRSNLQLLCETCNRRKHALDPIEFAQRMGLLL